ncbi:unnamed protein product [Mycena citricolor]|uniref:CBM1 domain-containing protein n=1 Tax=Mycena citricolor TaxID=2018698 RepID=A0AAD2GYW9_9AGAR|nr:unnamed protein product [Mycena citricolor]
MPASTTNLVRALLQLTFASLVLGQAPVYGQCGGMSFSGPTTCAAGSSCVFSNPWYSQCIPGAAPPTSTATAPPTTPTGPVNFWFAFGDSYTTTSFDPTMTLPSVGNPLGNPPFPGFTGGGGENYVGYDTVTYNKSTILTYNYAYGGATINGTLVPPYLPTVLSLIDQVTEFTTGPIVKKPVNAPWTSSNALFSIWIGINDLGNTFTNPNITSLNNVFMSEYFVQVEKLSLQLTESQIMSQGASNSALEKVAIADYNAKLKTNVASFAASHAGVKTWLWDSNTVFNTVLDSPTTYGFVDAVSFGNTGDFWGNNYHPGPAAHQIFAKDIAALMNSTIWF